MMGSCAGAVECFEASKVNFEIRHKINVKHAARALEENTNYIAKSTERKYKSMQIQIPRKCKLFDQDHIVNYPEKRVQDVVCCQGQISAL